jgi:hypothetical protein
MDAITRNVSEIDAEQRRTLEQVISHELRDNQQIIIRIMTPEAVPDAEQRAQAFADLRTLSEQASKRCESAGVTHQEIDEAMSHVRRRETR